MLTWAINTTAVTSFISSNVAGRTKKTMASGMFFFASEFSCGTHDVDRRNPS